MSKKRKIAAADEMESAEEIADCRDLAVRLPVTVDAGDLHRPSAAGGS